MAHRAGALSRGPPGPAHAPVGDEGLGLRLAWTTLGLGRRDGRGRQSVLAGALPELQDHVPVPGGQLRAGRRRAGALHRRRVSVVHPRHSPHGGGIAPHEPGLPPSSDPGHAMTALLQQWVTEQAERRPDATAVVMDGARMTYEELEASSNRLARTLKAAGCQQGDRVALLLAKSPLAIVSMVGTLKADCTYVPLDASSPAPRGSGHPPLPFVLSTFDVFGTLASGAQLHLVPPEINLLPNALAEFIRHAELTQWFSVPSLLSYMAKFDVVRFNDFPALRRLLWCGEVFPTPALRYWMARLPHATFTNLYGPTETTIASSYYAVPACPEHDGVAIPIGTPCEGEELLVLSDTLRPVSPGEVGDLYIRGVGLSPGYWRDPEKTRAAFVPNPMSPDPGDRLYRTGDLAKPGADGLVYFLGRADSQIKSRGYRIELGEIETALNAMDFIQECAVVAIPTDGFEGTVICCAYVPRPAVSVTPAVVRKELARVLPSPMLPSRWMAFERLPRNANGKFDRRQLQEAFANDETVAAEQS